MDGYLLVPKEWLEAIMENQKRILALLEKEAGVEKGSPLNGYISETEARKFLGRKTTWFWQMRSTGKLVFAKIGSKIFYHKNDIARLLESSSGVRKAKDQDFDINPLLRKI
jgi:hypothetical protein